MRQITEIIVHCSATQKEWMANSTGEEKVAEIRRWHTSKGWSDIGYHDLIDRDGRRYAGRPHSRAGAHVRGHNTGTLGVCLIGGHGSAETDTPSQNYTPAQLNALRRYLSEMRARYPEITKVSGHNEHAAKACPGFKVGALLDVWAKEGVVRDRDVGPDTESPPSFIESLFAAILGVLKSWKS